MFKEGDKVIFYKNNFTATRWLINLQMWEALNKKHELTIVRIRGNEVYCNYLNFDRAYSFHIYDLKPANQKSFKYTLEDLQKDFLNELLNPEVESLGEDYQPIIHKTHLEVGCQKINKKNAVFLAKRILWAYGE